MIPFTGFGPCLPGWGPVHRVGTINRSATIGSFVQTLDKRRFYLIFWPLELTVGDRATVSCHRLLSGKPVNRPAIPNSPPPQPYTGPPHPYTDNHKPSYTSAQPQHRPSTAHPQPPTRPYTGPPQPLHNPKWSEKGPPQDFAGNLGCQLRSCRSCFQVKKDKYRAGPSNNTLRN